MGFFSEIIAESGGRTARGAMLAYGSVDAPAKLGLPNGSLMLYHEDGTYATKRNMCNVELHIEAILGELWAEGLIEERPMLVPLDALPGKDRRRTLRPIRDDWALSEYGDYTRQAIACVARTPKTKKAIATLLSTKQTTSQEA